MDTIADQLKVARNASGMSAYRVAKLLGVTPANYSRWESGKTIPRADTFQRIIATCSGSATAEPAEVADDDPFA